MHGFYFHTYFLCRLILLLKRTKCFSASKKKSSKKCPDSLWQEGTEKGESLVRIKYASHSVFTKLTKGEFVLATEQQETIHTKNLIAYQRIYAPSKSGRMLLATECLGLNSKEL